ncbi:MAG: lysophospholipid acyltransferase family protein [Lysobacterales bacterium]
MSWRDAGNIKAIVRSAVALVVTVALFVPQALVRTVSRGPAAFVLPQLWHRALCRTLGIEVVQTGAIDTCPGTVYVGNHVSHFDIFVMGSCSRAAFIAKEDMARWPGMQLLGSMQQTLFVSRRARDAARVAQRVAEARRRGHRLVLFAEGTTSSGVDVAPFKSSLFSVLIDSGKHRSDDGAQRAPPRLQPFTIRLLETDSTALCQGGDRDVYAFHGGAPAGAHVWRFLRSRGARVEVVFHPPITVRPDMTRKSLAKTAHAIVAASLDSLG